MNTELKKQYEESCNNYVKELCKMYDWDFNDCWWVGDYIGEVICLSDMEYSLTMNDIKILVDENVSFETFDKWWQYNYKLSCVDNFIKRPICTSINLRSWIKGCPLPYTDDQMEILYNAYWALLQINKPN